MNTRFCIQEDIRDSKAVPCSLEKFYEVLKSPQVKNICAEIKTLSDERSTLLTMHNAQCTGDHAGEPAAHDARIKWIDNRKAFLKKQLPAFTFHAREFTNDKRSNKNALPSGLVMLDVDHIAEPRRFYEEHVAPKLTMHDAQCTVSHPGGTQIENHPDGTPDKNHAGGDDLHLCFVAVSPSGHGLRIVGECGTNEQLDEAQKRLADALGITEYDECTKDLARLSFASPMDYVLLINEELLCKKPEDYCFLPAPVESVCTDGCDTRPQTVLSVCPEEDGCNQSQTTQTTKCEQSECRSQSTLEYDGVPYATIFAAVLAEQGGEPNVGNRNNTLYECARRMRYICDFNATTLRSVLPTFGLPQSEVESTIKSAISVARNDRHKNELLALVEKLKYDDELTMHDAQCTGDNADDASTDDNSFAPAFDERFLPKPIDLLCRKLPPDFRPAMAISALPVLGALATNIRFKYLDNAEHSFSFLACVSAPAATGKSFLKTPINLMLLPIDEEDASEREKEQKYREDLRRAKNNAFQPQDPHAVIRHIPVTVSIAKLLQRLTYAEGKHLIAFESEIDAMLRSEKAGAWSQKSDFYRKAFDNDMYGQDYMSDNSFSATCNIYYNLLVSGTPDAVKKFFGNVENGLVTRVAFATLPDMFGTSIPDFATFNNYEKNRILETSRWLMEQSGTLSCDNLDESITEWLEAHRLHAIENENRAEDILRRRAAVMGYRAGMLAFLLNGRKWSKKIGNFAKWVSEYILQNQMNIFGAELEEVGERQSISGKRGDVKLLFSQLSDTFTSEEVSSLRVQSHKGANPVPTISRWKLNGMIEKIGKNTYRKTEKYLSAKRVKV